MRILHVPHGSGHPYVDDTEQRSPELPIAGEDVRLGARTSGEVAAVSAHVVQRDVGGRVLTDAVVAAQPVPRASRGVAVDGGHLASAQAKQARRAGGWTATVRVHPDAAEIAYRLTATDHHGGERATRRHRTDVAAWRAAPDSTVATTGAVGVIPGSVKILATRARIARVRVALPLAPGEHVAGFGERFDTLDQRGTSLDSQVFEQYKRQGAHRRTYMPMPFAHVVGGAGWGFHVQTSRRVWCDVGASDASRIVIEARTDSAVDAPSALIIATYAGTPTDVLAAFLDEVGHPEELPAWVLRLWASGNEWNTQAEVERHMRLHREHGIPVGALVIEAWSDESTFVAWRDAQYAPREDGGPLAKEDFSYPADGAWPDPQGMIDGLHEHGTRLLLWQIPLMKMRPHPRGQARHDADAAVRDARLIREEGADGKTRPYRNRGWWFPLSLMPDLTDPATATWWTGKRRYLVDMGVDGFKTDGGEHAWGDELHYLDGRRGDEANNTFPVAYAKAYGDLLRDAGKAPVTFSRAGFTGSQAHGAFWAGDENSTWEAFRWSMWAGLNAAACGVVYWGWDIAGFSGPVPDPELYVRAFAASAFVPIMQYHSEFNHHRKPPRDRTPWNVAELTGDHDVIAQVRDIVALRERLVPYLEQSARAAVETSRPLMRPLYFDHPNDPAVWQAAPQWTLGDDILVAPVLSPGESWDVYLPAGTWRDAWSGAPIAGGATVATSTPRHRVPVFVREEAWEALRGVFAP